MPTFDDIEAAIDTMKAACDATLTNFPDPKIKTSDIRGILDNVFLELKNIAEMAEADMAALNTTLAGKADSTHTQAISTVTGLQTALDSLTTALSGKANTSHTHTTSQVTGLDMALTGKADAAATTAALALKGDKTDLDKKPFIYFNGTQQNAPKMWLGSAVVSGGNAVFYLTDTGAAGGNAIFTSSTIFVQPILFAANAPPAFAPVTLSGDRKTLTIPTSKATTGISLLSVNLLGANTPANGETVSVWVVGI